MSFNWRIGVLVLAAGASLAADGVVMAQTADGPAGKRSRLATIGSACVEFAADGIAISKDGQTLYWPAIKGVALYRIPTWVLTDAGLNAAEVAAAVQPWGRNGVVDGLLIARGSERMYVTAPEEDAVKVLDLAEGPGATPRLLVQDKRLRWLDTFSEGPDGAIYVTTSRIQDSAFFEPDAAPALPTQWWRIRRGHGGRGRDQGGSEARCCGCHRRPLR